MLKALKWFGYIFLGLLSWALVHFISSEVARGYVRFLAFSITESYVFPECGGDCRKFVWDESLKFATYTSYFVVFLIYTAWLAIFLRFDVTITSKRWAKVIFILIFPTYTSWGVQSVCGGFGPCGIGYYVDIVTPTILSRNLLYMLVSAITAYGVVEVYSRLNKKIGYLT